MDAVKQALVERTTTTATDACGSSGGDLDSASPGDIAARLIAAMRIALTVTEMKALIITTRFLLHSEGPAELFSDHCRYDTCHPSNVQPLGNAASAPRLWRRLVMGKNGVSSDNE
jgi:hypothetical protein